LDVSQLNASSNAIKNIMEARMDLAVSKGCDGIEPDNVDAFANKVKTVKSVNGNTRVYGPAITSKQQINYNTFLANAAHYRNLSIGLKNDNDQVNELVSHFDWALNEQCFQYNECNVYQTFISHNKAVFGVEYEGNTATFCPKANSMKLSWLKKGIDLKALPYTACNKVN